MSEFVTDPLAHALDSLWHHPDFSERYQKLQESTRPGSSPAPDAGQMTPDVPPVKELVMLLLILAVSCVALHFSPQIGGAIARIGGLQ